MKSTDYHWHDAGSAALINYRHVFPLLVWGHVWFNSSASGANDVAGKRKWPGEVQRPGLFVLTFCFSNATLLIMQIDYRTPGLCGHRTVYAVSDGQCLFRSAPWKQKKRKKTNKLDKWKYEMTLRLQPASLAQTLRPSLFSPRPPLFLPGAAAPSAAMLCDTGRLERSVDASH